MISLFMIAAAILVSPDSLPSLARADGDAWVPREPPLRSQWCEENIQLPTALLASSRFSFEGREYQREILDAVDLVDVRELVFLAAPQTGGKTQLTRAIIQSQGEVDAAPMMFAGPDRDYVSEQRDVIYASCEITDALRRRIPPRRLRNNRWIDLGANYVYLAWSGSSQRLSGRSCKVVIVSEADRWRTSVTGQATVNPVNLAEKRVRAFWSPTVFYEGSPVANSPNLWRLYKSSDQRTFRVPCPHCGQYQELRFFVHKEGPFAGAGGVIGLKRADDSWKTPEEAKKDAEYLCEQGCVIDNADKSAMVAKGVWAPKGCDVVDGEVVGVPDYPGQRRGYQLNALYGPTVSFGDAVHYYLTNRDTEAGMLSFFNDWLSLPFQPRGKTPRWEELGRRLAGSYSLGFVPAAAYFLTGSADVHPDRVDWVVRAWGDGCTSWLIDFGSLFRVDRSAEGEEAQEQLASDLAQLDEAVLNKRWPVMGENPQGHSSLGVLKFGIDCGYRPTDVYAYVRAHPGDKVLAVNGDPKITPGLLYRLSHREVNSRTGKRYPAGTKSWGIDTAAYKADIQGRWNADRSAPGAWLLPGNILEVGEAYLRQITNERPRYEIRNGKKTVKWEVISEYIGSHDWDCEVYARALADMVVNQEWDAKIWGGPQRRVEPALAFTTPDGRPFFITER